MITFFCILKKSSVIFSTFFLPLKKNIFIICAAGHFHLTLKVTEIKLGFVCYLLGHPVQYSSGRYGFLTCPTVKMSTRYKATFQTVALSNRGRHLSRMCTIGYFFCKYQVNGKIPTSPGVLLNEFNAIRFFFVTAESL